ncbi:MAG: hypothetical protein H8D96_09310 [Desulfobacterales bacterium]|uniref:Uncharacterized protein n=1 Tax=Candidatus Desulfatibia vada TaxID=2841696 RepID=A0A8J6NRA0_9BACT|nr:hypothetical protein [Candidatus Desulfatibia vada]
MASINIIIDTENDTDFYTEVRTLLGVEAEDLPTATLQLDIMVGMAEREVCQIYVPNWQDVLNGDNPFAEKALRACVICKLCLNILEAPMVQNIFINEMRIVDIIMKSNIDIEKVKRDLTALMQSQLSIVGVVRTDAWPEKTIVGKTDSTTPYDYYVDTDGVIQEN